MFEEDAYLEHHGILGQKWGIRRYQNADGSWTPKGLEKLREANRKWLAKNDSKIQKKYVTNSMKKTASKAASKSSRNTKSATYANTYNKVLASLANEKVSSLTTPYGNAVAFVAKRGELGVMTAVKYGNYDMSKVKNGVWTNGRVAYKNDYVGR